MSKTFENLVSVVDEKIIGYLPDFLAGISLILIGWFLGWLLKKIIIQMMVVFRLERFLLRFRWGEDFSKADVRYGFYQFIGNIALFIIFVIFLIDALSVLRLNILSDLLQKGILFLPKIIIAFIVFGAGWLISSWAAKGIQRALLREGILRAALIARFSKAVLLFFFSAMALTELGIAREIVIIGFATIFITLGLLAIVAAVLGGKAFFKKIGESLGEE